MMTDLEHIAQTHPNLVMMAQHFESPKDLGAALGYKPSAVSNWFCTGEVPSQQPELAATYWLEARKKTSESMKTITAAELQRVNFNLTDLQRYDTHLLVSLPRSKLDKVLRVMDLLNCEAVELVSGSSVGGLTLTEAAMGSDKDMRDAIASGDTEMIARLRFEADLRAKMAEEYLDGR